LNIWRCRILSSPIRRYVVWYICAYTSRKKGLGSSVGIETRYRLDGSGIESRSKRDFPHPSRPAVGLIQPPI
jgi:hypothetical protein